MLNIVRIAGTGRPASSFNVSVDLSDVVSVTIRTVAVLAGDARGVPSVLRLRR